jgi:hypothetical protein
MKELNLLRDTDVKIKGIEALNNALGIAGALKFLMLLHREPTNYVEISRQVLMKSLRERVPDGLKINIKLGRVAKRRLPSTMDLRNKRIDLTRLSSSSVYSVNQLD